MGTALRDLRRTRRARRLGDTEWFDLAYRVYLAAIFGGSAVIIVSEQVGDRPLTDTALADVFEHGPAVLGLLAVIAVAAGLRGGATGGPVSIESADVRHLLLAPVNRARVVRGPLLQRCRSASWGGGLAGGIAGLLAAQRLPGTAPSWIVSGAAFGACVGALAVAAAALAHASHLPRPIVNAVALVVVAWQAAAVAERSIVGPADTLGSLALWGHRQHTVDLAGVGVVVVLVAVAAAVVGRLRVEHLARRGALVSQLRFAVTVQDLRTVVLLRRQLTHEQPRSRPWVRLAPRAGSASSAVVRRSLHGLARIPLARLGRMAVVAAGAGVAAGAVARGTTPAIVGVGIALFVMGLDLIEPLAQEIDHPDRTDGLPVATGWLHERLLLPPALLAVPLALIGATCCAIVATGSAPAAFALAVPVTWVGMAGAVVSAVRDEHDPTPAGDGLVVPPEVAGFRDMLRVALPVAVSTIGTVAILAVRDRPDAAMVGRALVGLVLVLTLVRWWVVHRSELRRRWQSFAAGARTGAA